MNSLNLKIELVSPLFLKAHDPSPKGDPILRATPFRGAVRFWLRALSGTQDITSLKQFEERVMGSTKLGSVISMYVKGTLKTDQRKALPHKNGLQVSGFIEGQTFDLGIRCRPGLEFPREGLLALLFWLNFGGVGKRARRGFGSLQCVGVNVDHAIIPEDMKSLFWKDLPSDGRALTERLSNILLYIPGLQKSKEVPDETHFEIKPYPCLQTKGWTIAVSPKAFRNYEEAMINFWTSYREIYKKSPTAFGSINPRRASPVHLHISKSCAGYHLVLTAFFAQPAETQEIKPIHSLLETFCNRFQGIVFYC
ncbi:RAMP superfamily CRISPR-associated protein [Anaerolinea sp.]|uniref:RAMP superfamily CRISPR-associated protein n=1 Tax=Anaerolinea sp. TaxID=1872519 RepID=UPI002ACD59B8|nr:RAMP superfamily CRISPR-associated protein [Anaerolinea sp.]